MAGDRVELACDVTALQLDYNQQQQHQQQQQSDQQENGRVEALKQASRFSSFGLSRLSSSLSTRSSGRSNRHHTDGRGRHRRYNRGHNEDWLVEHGGSGDEDVYHHAPVTEQGYLVLWFVDPDRKPFYR